MIKFYASPNGLGDGLTESTPTTLDNVKLLVRANSSVDNITVYLRGGIYYRTETLLFNNLDAGVGDFKVLWRNYPNEKPILSGGISVTGWTLHDAAKNIWRINTPPGLYFRQFTVNERMAHKPRVMGSDLNIYEYGFLNGRVTYGGEVAQNFSRPQDLEFIMLFGTQLWNRSRVCVDSAVKVGGYTTFTLVERSQELFEKLSIWGYRTPMETPAFVENAYEFLNATTKGGFYLNRDTSTVYYVPRDGEDMTTAVGYCHVLEKLIEVDNTEPLNLLFHGIKLSHTTWNWEQEREGILIDGQTNIFDDVLSYPQVTPGETYETDKWDLFVAIGALHITQGSNLKILNCDFSNLGGYGFFSGNHAHNIEIRGSRFSDIAANGLTLGSLDEPINWRHYFGPIDNIHSTNVHTINNKLSNIGWEYIGAVPICYNNVHHFRAENNTIFGGDYGGIYGGIYAGHGLRLDMEVEGKAYIKRNKISDLMSFCRDGGGIYTGVGFAELYIEENHIWNMSDITPTPSGPSHYANCIYNDYGSRGIHVTKNVCLTNPNGGPHAWLNTSNYAVTVPERPYPLNKYGGNFYEISGWRAHYWNSPPLPEQQIYGPDTGINSDPVLWPQEAKDIVNKAGVKLLDHEPFADEILLFGWKEPGETVSLSTVSGTIEDYEELSDDRWAATLKNLEDGTIVTAQSSGKTEYLTIGEIASPIKGVQQLSITIKGQGGIIFPFNIKL